jgi:hypothetical protein
MAQYYHTSADRGSENLRRKMVIKSLDPEVAKQLICQCQTRR